MMVEVLILKREIQNRWKKVVVSTAVKVFRCLQWGQGILGIALDTVLPGLVPKNKIIA